MNYLDLLYLLITVFIIVLATFGAIFALFAWSRRADAYAMHNLTETSKVEHQKLMQAYGYIEHLKVSNRVVEEGILNPTPGTHEVLSNDKPE